MGAKDKTREETQDQTQDERGPLTEARVAELIAEGIKAGLAPALASQAKAMDTKLARVLEDFQSKPSPEEADADKQMAVLERKLAEVQARWSAERRKVAEREAEASVSAELRKAGIREAFIPDRIAAMWRSGELSVAEDGQAVMKGQPLYEGGEPQVLSIADAVAAWAKTDAACAYKAPQQGMGSGGQVGQPHGHHAQGEVTSLDDLIGNIFQ